VTQQETYQSVTGGATLAPPQGEAPADAVWWVVHTRSRQEKAVAGGLAARGVEHFLPTVRREKRYGHRRRVVEHPLFSCYLFMRGDARARVAAYETQRIASVIAVKDQRRFEHEMAQIRLALEGGAELDPYPYLDVGRPVRVRSGPMRGVEGIVERRQSVHRLVLRVHVLNRAVGLEIDGHLLEPMD